MQYALILAGAAVAQAANAHEHRHGRLHGKRAVVTDVEVDYVTVVETVTVGGAAPTTQKQYVAPTHSSYAPAPSAYSSSASSSYVAPVVESSSASSVYVVPVESSSSAAAPSSTLTTSVSSVASIAASSSPSSVAATSSYASSAASSSASASPSGVSSGNLTPNGKKAGLSGYIGIQDKASFSALSPYISWYSDYTPNTPDVDGVMGIGMLWGADGSPCGSDMVRTIDKPNGNPMI